MEKKQLGNTDLKVSTVCFGGNVFGWTIDAALSFNLLDAFTDGGFNFIDTANSYSYWVPGNSGGESETIIGNWMHARGKRNDVVIATKVGSAMGKGKNDISKKAILHEAEQSLRRLKTDYIDLYQTHWDDNHTPVEETLAAYDQLVSSGKVRWIGASNLSPEKLTTSLSASRELNYPAYQSFQPHYNLCERALFESQHEQICLDNNLGAIPYYSLASGFLTGKYRSEADLGKSQRGDSVKKYLNEKGFRILAALDAVAASTKSCPASVALAWLIARPAITAPIASATNIVQLTTLMNAATLHLSTSELTLLDTASAW